MRKTWKLQLERKKQCGKGKSEFIKCVAQVDKTGQKLLSFYVFLTAALNNCSFQTRKKILPSSGQIKGH